MAWAGEPPRAFAGVAGRLPGGRLQAAVALARGAGWNLRVERIDAAAMPAPSAADAASETIALLAELCRRANVPIATLETIGTTVAGAPPDFAAELAFAAGVTVAADFSAADRAAGGRGAPLAPLADALALRAMHPRLLLHLGRTARLTAIPTLRQSVAPPLSFDIGPCGGLLDALAAALSDGRMPCDLGGSQAVQGQVIEPLLAEWCGHPFVRRAPPRFLAGDEFGAAFVAAALEHARVLRADGPSLLRTAVEFIVRNLTSALRRAGVEPGLETVLTGRARKNGLLRKRLGEVLAPGRVTVADELGIPADAPAAVQAALLAYCLTEGLPANVPALTGARESRLLGTATPGAALHWRGWLDLAADKLDDRAAA